ncbi:MAG TPA: VOC family protein [Steroidobacteraceae bacterium]|jgi:predicted enzyme related to lactoylglutathione lyase|nr:VOC family protein [Steroidobacteraceae bacterium]
MLLGLRTAIYHTPDIAAGKLWYMKVLGFPPYFDQPFYVGFNVGGYELGLTPGSDGDRGKSAVGAYWGVKDVTAAYARLLELGAAPRTDIQDVGENIRVADVLDPWGNVFGIIENPNFKLTV